MTESPRLVRCRGTNRTLELLLPDKESARTEDEPGYLAGSAHVTLGSSMRSRNVR